MRVTREQAAAHRERILDVAGTLFRERGFDRIGVADVMKQAGLTHGGFYGHFKSKEDLAAEITARVLGRKGWPERLTGTPTSKSTGDDGRSNGRSHSCARRGRSTAVGRNPRCGGIDIWTVALGLTA